MGTTLWKAWMVERGAGRTSVLRTILPRAAPRAERDVRKRRGRVFNIQEGVRPGGENTDRASRCALEVGRS